MILLRTSQVAERLNVSNSFVRKLVSTRKIPHLRIGRAVRFRTTDVDSYVDRRVAGGESAPAPAK